MSAGGAVGGGGCFIILVSRYKEPYVSKNLKRNPAIIIEVTCAT